jgi:hypothetical protein
MVTPYASELNTFKAMPFVMDVWDLWLRSTQQCTMLTIDNNGSSLYRTRYAPGVRELKVLLELLLRLALPSEGLQLPLQEQLWQLLKAL